MSQKDATSVAAVSITQTDNLNRVTVYVCISQNYDAPFVGNVGGSGRLEFVGDFIVVTFVV
jgi:hypothetical protein